MNETIDDDNKSVVVALFVFVFYNIIFVTFTYAR